MRRTIIIVSVVLSVVLVMLASFVGFLYTLKRRRSIVQEKIKFEDGEDQQHVKSQEFPSMSLDLIITATQGFLEVNKLGEGGFGPVYKGTLDDGKEIAVKRLSRSSYQGLQELKNEVMLIARLQHRNLVRLLGCCLEGNESILVYEYMPNKSLDFFLFDATRAPKLDWNRRFSIIDGIARGLLYLHEDSRLRIIHRDLKASNILLDHELNPKISDFGMARIVGINQSGANTNRVVGTYGYMAPEYALNGLFSVKSDVFSFGVLLLEIVSGKKNWSFDSSGKNLIIFAWEEWKNCNELELVDPSLMETCVPSEVLKCIQIGLLCVQEDPIDRPTMSSVVVMLRSSTTKLPRPRQPAFMLNRHAPRSPQSQDVKVFSNNVTTFSNVAPR
ncbi:cysteine-rich receptor-like protein kinase 10 [Impatiens glandulifera]|uniref:cysteine-rich receptor-like protein kinase 10 n=1 Tax=Impatiens glandulifera TaxID=253017 RepID=UPI001FB114EF|nr:cysteine-rich receptor-like protein kinase 10 [Impatiens glandulifera]